MHPRYGLVMAVVASEDVEAGDEVTVNYNYDGDGDNPEWFVRARKGSFQSPLGLMLHLFFPFRILETFSS